VRRTGWPPFARQLAEDDLVREVPVDPGRAAEGALRHEPGPGRRGNHRVVVGQGLDLQPVQAADGEAVAAQHADDVGAQVLPAERGKQGDPEVRDAVVQVHGPQEGLAGQFPGGQLDHGELDIPADVAVAAVVVTGAARPPGRPGRHRPPGAVVAAHPRLDVVHEFGLEDRDVTVLLGAQPDQLSA